MVFEELDKEATEKSDRQLVGDGKMDGEKDAADGYKLAKNVIVKLYEVVQKKSELDEVEEEFLVDTGMWSRTDENGEYSFGDKVDENLNGTAGENSVDDRYRLHAGLYVVRFVYGDEADKLVTVDGNTIRYSGQDYQSVKYSDPGDVNKEDEIIEASKFTDLTGLTTEENSKLVGFDKNHSEGEKVVSVAKDNEIRRLEVNEYSTTMTYLMDTVLKAKENTDETKLLAEHTSMFADTKEFNMQIEYYGNYDKKEEKEIDGSVTDYYYYSVRDVNFGLIERPKTKLQLMNDVKEIRAITSDGETILDLVFDIKYNKNEKGAMEHTSELNEEKSTGTGQAQVLNRNGKNQGFRYVNVDTEILQGMRIAVKFQIAVANISEVDHLTSWLETKIEGGKDPSSQVQKGANVDLKVDFEETEKGPKVTKDGNKVKDIIETTYGSEKEKTGREYDYTNSYLHELLNNKGVVGESDADTTSKGLKEADNGIYNYGTQTSSKIEGIGSENIKKAYSYTNIVKKVQPTYKTGYYLGNLYYNNEIEEGKQAQVRTRVDQYIDYVDNDLIFKPEENTNDNGKIKYLTYTAEEIAERGLLKDIDIETKVITDGEKEYYNKDKENVNNNLAFNIEDPEVNKDFYKYLPRIPKDKYTAKTEETEDLYLITLEASRILTSEMDLEGVVIDNLAEIIKVANTAGRKVYVREDEIEEDEKVTGNIGNTTKPPIEVNDPNRDDELPKTLVEVSEPETDTDFTEYITFSPPTGLNPIEAETRKTVEKTTNAMLLIIPTVIIIAGVSYVTIQFVRSKKFYK